MKTRQIKKFNHAYDRLVDSLQDYHCGRIFRDGVFDDKLSFIDRRLSTRKPMKSRMHILNSELHLDRREHFALQNNFDRPVWRAAMLDVKEATNDPDDLPF